jgi:hypothetical protein
MVRRVILLKWLDAPEHRARLSSRSTRRRCEQLMSIMSIKVAGRSADAE